MTSEEFAVLIEPGGHTIRVSRDTNVLDVALAAGLALPHSCRGGRCASCKSRLLSGVIEYPYGTPPGITAAEIARGEVLLCQARPRSDLRIETRRVTSINSIEAELTGFERLPFGALKVGLRRTTDATFGARPGQFVDLDNGAAVFDRVVLIEAANGTLAVEVVHDSPLAEWLEASTRVGTLMRLTGPFDAAR
jgi:ferredoxin